MSNEQPITDYVPLKRGAPPHPSQPPTKAHAGRQTTAASSAPAQTSATASTDAKVKNETSTSTAGPSPPRVNLPFTRSVADFHFMEQVGEGTYGEVFKARDLQTQQLVALKRIRMDKEKEGFPQTALREIKILRQLNHVNVIHLREIVVDDTKSPALIYMVFDYLEHDLAGLIEYSRRNAQPFALGQIKTYAKQMLEGLHFLHRNSILHRDLKASNLLVSRQGVLKIGDFGLSRPYTTRIAKYTDTVITLWYRPPELLLGERNYDTKVDVWSAGCIIAQLLLRRPLFNGDSELKQLQLIFKICGTPTEVTWPGVSKIRFFHLIENSEKHPPRLRQALAHLSTYQHAIDLLESLLALNPKDRFSASKALDNDFFWCNPLPFKTDQMPQYPQIHEYTAKLQYQKAKAAQ